MSMRHEDGYIHIEPKDCGKTVRLSNPNYSYKTNVEVQMVITGPKGRMAIFKGCNPEISKQAIQEFMEFQND